VNGWDLCGLVGVSLILAAYAGAQARRLDPTRAPSLWMNLAGSGMIILSLLRRFNLSAFLVEAAWAAIAAFGLLRLLLQRRR
jgi:hypothetical protein